MDDRLRAIIDKRKPELTRKARLEQMPKCKAFIDDIAKAFDRHIASIEAKENGHEITWRR